MQNKIKTVAIIFIVSVLLAPSLHLTIPIIHKVSAEGQWTGHICICKNGTVLPSDAPINKINYNTYVLTSNIHMDTSSDYGILIEKENVTLIGNGYSIIGENTYRSKGIFLNNTNNITIKDILIGNVSNGIYSNNTYELKIMNITIQGPNKNRGIYIIADNINEIINLTIRDSTFINLSVGINIEGSSNNSVVDAKSFNAHIYNNRFINNAGPIAVYTARNVTIVENMIIDETNSRCETGIMIRYSENITLYRNSIENCTYDGVEFSESFNVTIEENSILRIPFGIQVLNCGDVTILKNTLVGKQSRYAAGILVVNYKGIPSNLEIHYNNLGEVYGKAIWIAKTTSEVNIDASLNWWGDISGPSGAGFGKGKEIEENIVFQPWLSAPYPYGEPVNGTGGRYVADSVSNIIDLRDKWNVTISYATTSDVLVGFVNYTLFPNSLKIGADYERYFDIYTNTSDGLEYLEIRLYYNETILDDLGVKETSLLAYWLSPSGWRLASDQGVNTDENYVWVRITNSTDPSLSWLNGTPIGIAGYSGPGTVGGTLYGNSIDENTIYNQLYYGAGTILSLTVILYTILRKYNNCSI